MSILERPIYLRNRGCEDYNLIEFTNPLHELIYSRPLYDVDIMELALDLNRYCEVGLVKYLFQLAWRLLERQLTHLEATVDQGLI